MSMLKSVAISLVGLLLFIPAPQAEEILIEKEDTFQAEKRLINHKVERGEELHLLAGYYLLNTREWNKIIAWNRDIISNSNRLYPGEELTIYVETDWAPPFDLDDYVKEIGRR